ncbi:intermembrane lipid transfer protein VPS13-like isoform X1 [Silene latifolia]|uniref:intermembrane lipid transfer protein VPS13-like isoform X1 n=3 Tax=Silene latifolia TaxID=37657 RepID=UPI003D7820C3
MFEGLVRQLLLGYLGRYIKDFQKEQLKITFWNEEVLLENVELILEAFDYLQLPVALKRGHIGRLSIRIPWMKLGWDPIIILVEDVFFSAGPRDDDEWSADAVETRELAAKKAKLAAAELAKLSRRVSDNQAGQSLLSHVTGRILDSVQVSMRNVHILYSETQPHPMLFGLTFSSLTVPKPDSIGSSISKGKGCQVNKSVEIKGLGIYCNTFQESSDLMGTFADGKRQSWLDAQNDVDKFDYMVAPFDMCLLVTKTEKVEHDAPKYSVTAELTKLAMTINPDQLEHVLKFSDYITTCQLREKYGRYRPCGGPLSRKANGWQKLWWRYAQESILYDVRKTLKKTSWKYFGQRLDCRRKYVNLYKVKLNFLQSDQQVDQDVLLELENMEKDSDIDDILQFRFIAEQELEVSIKPISREVVEFGSATSEKLANDEATSGKARGWLNWLSRGVLGAGGTDDSSQFSGVVSDEVIKDICEATKFQPVPSVGVAANSTTLIFAVNFQIFQMSLLMQNGNRGQEIAELNCSSVEFKCNVWEESTSIAVKVGYAEVVHSSKQIAILRTKKELGNEDVLMSEKPSANIDIDLSTKSDVADLVLKVTVQPTEIYFDLEFLLQLMEFYTVLTSHKSLHERVLFSLNGIRDDKSRLLCKTECLLSGKQRIIWTVTFIDISIHLPWINKNSEKCSMVMQTSYLRLSSNLDMTSFASDREDFSDLLYLDNAGDILDALQFSDLYDQYEASMTDFQITLLLPNIPHGLSVVEKFSTSVAFACCLIPDELILKQLEASLLVSSLHVHFSISIVGALVSLAEYMDRLYFDYEQGRELKVVSPVVSSYPSVPWCFSVASNFDLFKLGINLEDDGDNSSILLINLQQLHLKFACNEVEDCQISMGALKISSYRQSCEDMSNTICLSTLPSEQNKSLDGCFVLNCVGQKSQHIIRHMFTVQLRNFEFHCYPKIMGLLIRFSEKLMDFKGDGADDKPFSQMELKPTDVPTFTFERFGLSNFSKNELTEWAALPLDQFPFVRIHNSGQLRSVESAIIVPDSRNFGINDKNCVAPTSDKVLKSPLQRSKGNLSFWEIDLNIANVDLHFHDSSCTVGIMNLPVGKASVLGHGDSFDVLCSMKELTLFSAQWTYNLREFLWGPSQPSQSPVLNIRVRKGLAYLLNSDLEISFGVHHVCCVLPPDYLALLIGYFSSPDWSLGNSIHTSNTNGGRVDSNKLESVIYKFEILDSVIMSPVICNDNQFLKLDLQQLYGSFIVSDTLDEALAGILSDFSVTEDKVANNADSLNIFGRDMCLSLLILKDCASTTSSFDQETGYESHRLIQSNSFDLWLRFQDESQSSPLGCASPLCLMIKVASCELTAEDNYYLPGFEAVSEVVDEYSLVEMKSRCFTGDTPVFLQLVKSLSAKTDTIPNESSSGITEIRCFVNHMSIRLICLEGASSSQALAAIVNTGFELSATMENDVNLRLSTQFLSIMLSSSVKSTCLAKFLSENSSSSVLDIYLSITQRNKIELLIAVPSLEIWFHMLDWVIFVDHINSFILQFPRDSPFEVPSSTIDPFDISAQKHGLPIAMPSKSDKTGPNDMAIIVTSKNINVLCHIPIWISEEAVPQFENCNGRGGLDTEDVNCVGGGKDSKFVTISLHSRSSKLYFRGNNLDVKISFEKATGLVGICESGVVQSWPFFHIHQLAAEIRLCDLGKVGMGVNVDISCQAFDVKLSHQVFYFCNGIQFSAAEPGTSEVSFGNVDLKIHIDKLSLLLTDGRWSFNGPLIELLMKNLCIETSLTENSIRFVSDGDLLINYNNILKVFWEPFIEPWTFRVHVIRQWDKSALFDSGIVTDVQLESITELNVNITKSFCEVISRSLNMIKEARGLMQINEVPRCQRFQNYQFVESFCARRFASYVIYNKTSLPFLFQVYQGLGNAETIDTSSAAYENTIPPGSSLPIYIDGTPEEQSLYSRPSSESFTKKLSNKAEHYFMTIQFEGTYDKSEPVSMDLVGLTYFEVNFSRDNKGSCSDTGLLVPVVFDVSLQQYSKLIQLYSTVIFHNSTSTPLELRVDIPFSMSSKIVDLILPGKEFPLPLHLAEAGHVSWRPRGNNYLWSEVHNLSKILSSESRSGFLRSLVCYPSNPKDSYVFRCCLSVQDTILPLSGRLKRRWSHINDALTQTVEAGRQLCNNKLKTRFIHHVALTTPFTVKNYLPEAVSVAIEGGGVTHNASLTEEEVSFFHIDSYHDLSVTFCMAGFRPQTVKFPRAEAFTSTAKPCGTVLSLTETITFSSDSPDGPVYVTVEKTMDSSSGARELCIFVPFLLYNCTGFVLTISRSDHELKGNYRILPTCYSSTEDVVILNQKDGLHLITMEEKSNSKAVNFGSESYLCKNHIISSKKIGSPPVGIFITQSSLSQSGSTGCHQSVNQVDMAKQESRQDSNHQSDFEVSNIFRSKSGKVKPFMYSPDPNAAASEVMVRVSRCHTEYSSDNMSSSAWSSPFFLISPSGSNALLVPHPSNNNSAAVLSVTSHLLGDPLTGRTRAVTFQPRYVISNACSKALCYKQKGTDLLYRLGAGQHSHLHWIDTTRELLIAVRFDEPGWQWSGSFLPDHVGDTQVKMRNYVSGTLNMIRVEVQNADVIQDEKIIGDTERKSGTIFILLSDDDTGFVPYRIDNFSKETLRIYQQKCETLETIVHPYTSCSYAWDEPFYPHRLVVEVPGERIIGSYTLDDTKEYAPVRLSSSSMSFEKHERTLLPSVHAEGAMKVLSIIDSSCHSLGEVKNSSSILFGRKMEAREGNYNIFKYKDKISIRLSCVGISIMDSSPQELLYLSAQGIKIDCLQDMEQQRFSFQISCLQIDNQLCGTPYPVVLSFDDDYKSSLVSHVKIKEGGTKNENFLSQASGSSSDPVICLEASKWRDKDMMLISFEYISLRFKDSLLAIDLEMLLKLVDFYKSNPLLNPEIATSVCKMDDLQRPSAVDKSPAHSDFVRANGSSKLDYSPSDQTTRSTSLPEIIPVGAPWQKIFLLARRQKKIYMEALYVSSFKVTLSFSSSPLILKHGGLSSSDSFINRRIMAFADVEGAQICLKELTITHHMASWESVEEILSKHYTRRFLHELYKVFGSAGVIGNPIGFARSIGLGFKDFLSVPAKGVLQSPSGLFTGMAKGTSSLLSNTMYAISDTATQFSKAAHKGVLAFTFDDHSSTKPENQRAVAYSQSKGVINELLEGLTGLLQSPIRGAEKHGLPGVLSGFALGVTGLVAKPAASVLEATGKTAQSIRNRSRVHKMRTRNLRVRLPRSLSSELPLRPYSWEEAIGTAVLSEVEDGSKYGDEVLVMCKSLKDAGKFVILTEKLIMIVECSSLIDLGQPDFRGIVAEPEWIVGVEIALESVIHADVDDSIVHIVGSSSEIPLGQSQHHSRRSGVRTKRWRETPTTLPLFQTSLELLTVEEADYFLKVLLSTIEMGKEIGWGNVHLLHQSKLK